MGGQGGRPSELPVSLTPHGRWHLSGEEDGGQVGGAS